MKTKIYLCADDFAMSPAICAGILELLGSKRLTSTSCMTDSPYWKEFGGVLRESYPECNVGLHLNFTHRFDVGAGPVYRLGPLIARAVCGGLGKGKIRAAVCRQLDGFEAVMHRPPAFVDGHQHVHVLTGVRGVLLDVLAERYPSRAVAVRNVGTLLPSIHYSPKGVALRMLGRGFAERLAKSNIRFNPCFGGLYNLDTSADFSELMKSWLVECPDQTLLMCHPGHAEQGTSRVLHPKCRVAEFDYLSSDAFTEDLDEEGCELAMAAELPF